MVFLMKMVFAIELLKHTNNQYGILQLQKLRIRVGILRKLNGGIKFHPTLLLVFVA